MTDPNYYTLYELWQLSLVESDTASSSDLKAVLTPADQSSIDAISSTAPVRSVAQFSIPEGKLFYPEPFIASPSYVHSDLSFLHVLQYWYWLWFMFIFLICFFFISFLCTVRWCNNRVRPRRETRGVSRSKCGDLITACVPVSWAISIIVHESTDATDLNDGFGTAELVVGVRAYQWGWEYYYPRTIDLNYNVRPSYSSFVGNSLKYNFSSSKNLSANSLWRMYQNKSEDRVVTPAHLLLIPSDSSNMINFLNFKSIGLNTLEESSAFAKIRNSTKVYNSHLVHTPSTFTSKYHKLNSLYLDENSYLTSSSFGVRKQHNLAAVSSLGNSFASTTLDTQSFNEFLESNLKSSLTLESDVLRAKASPLSLNKNNVISSPKDSSRLLNLLEGNNSSPVNPLSDYPTILENINDNSDKSGLSYPLAKITSIASSTGNLQAKELSFSQANLAAASSITVDHSSATIKNLSSSSKEFNLNGPNSKVLLGDQSIRNLPEITPTKSNLNLSTNSNTVTSNTKFLENSNRSGSPFTSASDLSVDHLDYTLFNNLSSSRSFAATPIPALISSDTHRSNSLDYDTTSTASHELSRTKNEVYTHSETRKRSNVGEVFVGSREKTPKSINSAYWSTFWSTSNPAHRVSGALIGDLERTNFYLPAFSTYADYDFRNDQAIDMLEELFWENSYSSYNFYDYMSLEKNSYASSTSTPKDISLGSYFPTSTLGIEGTSNFLTAAALKDLSLVGSSYANSVQMEDYPTSPSLMKTHNFALLPLTSELSETDESYTNLKSAAGLLSKYSTTIVGGHNSALAPRSYLSVFNYFRSDYDDFSWQRSLSSSTNAPLLDAMQALNSTTRYDSLLTDAALSVEEGSSLGSDLRISNPVTLRSSVRNSVVNYNAFQKVFKPRLDEGRAHVQSSSFADMGLKQPFISDSKIPYSQLLGKNRDSFYETPLFYSTAHKNYNTSATLIDSLNTPMYDFPFLLAKTSDTMRFTWVDWFAKWKYIEVQPSSISRYSTLGVPYLRRAFDFNSSTGDKFQDTELYFTRVARSRRNYLPTWSYSPFMYNRTYLWNALSSFDASFLNPYASSDSAKLACISMTWYWKSLGFGNFTSDAVSFSSSGNDVYGKSTWKPQSSIQQYYYNVSKLVDILSRREFLYRQYLETSKRMVHIPKSLCSTPNNPLFAELKSSFLFSDPVNYSSEFSRDLFYTSASYFKFVYFKHLVQSTSENLTALPINPSLLTNYTFFYFFGTNGNKVGNNSELYKSQFRPLKKGISNMLRLHATGAVAMPIEIRLQVLASSRDVIHSWSIPSASIKIDCVPGYTSHRTMKFLLTGVYWGQCQEICGRYHHWMPIVVYFMKRDLFFLWCTHFVFTPAQNETWDISDRRFAAFIKFASYDRSTWLNEFGLSS